MLPLITTALELVNKLVKPAHQKARQAIIDWLPGAVARQTLRKKQNEEDLNKSNRPDSSK
jgi:hypothetical protein